MSTITSTDGTIIDYDKAGEGPGVIFIGGAVEYRTPGRPIADLARRLASAGYSVLEYDRRGRGRSGDSSPWSLDREVDDLNGLIATLNAPATLYTSSSGATVALAAAQGGANVAALALYDPPFFKGDGLAEPLARIRSLLAEGQYEEAMRHNLTDVVGLPADAVSQMAGAPFWQGMVDIAPTLAYDLGAVHDVAVDPDWSKRWSGVTARTVVYSGEESFAGMAEAADAVAGALPNATRRVVPGQAHQPAADVMAPILIEFLRG